MKGIYIKNFCESLEYSSELEFEYQNTKYVIQPLLKDEKYWLTAWKIIDDKNAICMVKEEIHSKKRYRKRGN